MIGRQPCMRCANFIEGERSPFTWKCKAFPDGIPMKNKTTLTANRSELFVNSQL